jgi:hypothetical protein
VEEAFSLKRAGFTRWNTIKKPLTFSYSTWYVGFSVGTSGQCHANSVSVDLSIKLILRAPNSGKITKRSLSFLRIKPLNSPAKVALNDK